MDHLKQQVVDAVFARLEKVEGDSIYDVYDEPPTIHIMERENLKRQLVVRTPAGPRFFEVIVKEAY